MSVLFMHYEIEPRLLQPHVPFALDLRDGRAYVSLVAFSQQKLRLAYGGALTAWAGALTGNHHFLNVRTYIREQAEPGIHFIAEWVPNRLATWVAPPLYGLPYRLGRLEYDESAGLVTGQRGVLQFQFNRPGGDLAPCAAGSLDAFLLERYMAVTQRGKIRRRFRVAHPPWPQRRVDAEVIEDSLLQREFPWWKPARLVGANFSPGVPVTIGRPERLTGEKPC